LSGGTDEDGQNTDEYSISGATENPILKFLKAVWAWIVMIALKVWNAITGGPGETSTTEASEPLSIDVTGEAIQGAEIQIGTTVGETPVAGSQITVNDNDVGSTDDLGTVTYVVPSDTSLLSIRAFDPTSSQWADLLLNIAPVEDDASDIENIQGEAVPEEVEPPIILTPPAGRIKSISRVYWTGRVQSVHGVPMLLDNTGTASPQTIDAVQFKGSVDDMLTTSQELRSLLDDPPVVSPRHNSVDDADGVTSVLVSEYELQTYRLLEKLELLLRDTESISASLPVLSRTSIPRALSADSDSMVEGDVTPVIPNDETLSLDSEIERISSQEQMTATDQLRDSFLAVRDSMRNDLEELADTRDQSLNEILGKDLDDLIRYYDFPMYDFYCPDCFDRRMDEAGVNLTEDDFKLDQVSAEHIKAAEEKLRSSILSIRGDLWVCPLCHWSGEFDAPDTTAPLDANSPRYMHRVWSNLVAPVWERLWSEKSTHDERARIVREKETERRRNLNEEFNELNDLKNEFSMDRRRMQEGLDSLRLSSVRSRELLLSLLQAFEDMSMISNTEIETHRQKIKAMDQTHRGGFEGSLVTIDKSEDHFSELVENSGNSHTPIIDPDFQIRGPSMYKQLDPINAAKEPQVLLKGGKVTDEEDKDE
jgi:hypothetical protein